MPSFATIRGIRYMNCGDWVESCTRAGRARGRPIPRIITWNRSGPRAGSGLAAVVAARAAWGDPCASWVATDAWHPQVNGWVRTLTRRRSPPARLAPRSLPDAGIFRTFAIGRASRSAPGAAAPRQGRPPDRRGAPDAIHLSRPKARSACWSGAIAASMICRSRPAFTPASPIYVSARAPVPNPGVGLAWFHGTSEAVMPRPRAGRELRRARVSQTVVPVAAWR